MVSDDSPFGDVSADRDYLRVLLTAVCVVALLLAAATLPILAPAGAQSPAESLVPLPGESPFEGGSSPGGSGGGLGALNPGGQTSVGGDLGGDGAFTSQSTETHFTVRSAEPAYWRTAAYGNYTGAGWTGRARPRPYDGPIPTEGLADATVSYDVQLAKSASSLPTVWRPRTVSRDDVLVTQDRAITTERALPAGTTYSATSVTPPDDPAVLRASGRDYPEHIEERYTGVPAESSARIGPFTDRLTADSESPYETATIVERWLEANKNYSLNVSQPPDDDVASEFVFEMDEGYCEYFATSMAVMLRSQDIPARYVVGYSTGERTGRSEYTVRGMNAHAWVEVYFEGVGWVKFDPTPGQERLASEQQAMRNASQSYSASESGSPGENFSVGTPTPTPPGTAAPTDGEGTGATGADETGTETDGGSDSGDSDGESSGDDAGGESDAFSVELNRTATPGAAVTATVTRDGAPIEGAAVYFNGEPVGTTGPDGTVVGTVPYEERLTISVSAPGGEPSLSVPAVPRDAGRAFAVAGPRAQQSANETFDLETEAAVSVTGETVTGGEVTVTASVDDVPVREAAVFRNDERVATTDRRGRATVTLPSEPGEVLLTVRRGSVRGNATVELERLAVSTSPTLPLALPGTGQTVNATMGGEPVANATIELDGTPVASTGATGTATVGLPLASGAELAVSKHGQTATTTVGGLFVNAALVGVPLAALLVGSVAGARRRNVTPATLLALLGAAREAAVGALVALAGLCDDLLVSLRDRLALTAAALRDLVAGRATPSELLAALRAWLRDRRAAAEEAVGDAFGAASGAEAASSDGDAARITVREAWSRFLGHVSLRRYWTRTPGEIAAHAIERDRLPPAAVRTVRDAFRAVEYGQRDAESHVEGIEEAIQTIEAAAREREAGDDATDGSEGRS
ncbi:transglutaminase TgpA family protein [Haloarcula salina]|uniref:transglutaminase TgpA family protein n=1 Tax=Haloarcula salina TaxID=1429914 RepID=UPI003C6FFD97